MKYVIESTPQELGKKAAEHTAEILRQAIAQNGSARLILSTGASQFTTLEALIQQDVEWNKVEMFHLDEYIGISPQHPASFVNYLQNRFVKHLPLKEVHFVDTTRDVETLMEELEQELDRAPVDVGLIGIGENAHIAFNDPPADFSDTNAYKIVTLADKCRRQQLGEGWFATLEDVPAQAVSMTVDRILKCKHIICPVPYAVKAQAIYDTYTAPSVTEQIPATALRTHADTTVYLDQDSSAQIADLL